MKIICLSDTHTKHDRAAFPVIEKCDLLIHAGDATFKGLKHEVMPFLNWMAAQPAKHKVFVPGNHDIGFQYPESTRDEYLAYAKDLGIHVLIDEGIEIEGKFVYGTPWTPFFFAWAFNGYEATRDWMYYGGPSYLALEYGTGQSVLPNENLRDVYAKIPDHTQILICHGPPAYAEMDRIPHSRQNRAGSQLLLERIEELNQLQLGVFGHLHSGYGIYQYTNKNNVTSTLVNAAMLDEEYTLNEGRKAIEVNL